ncbi:hypothetical protein BH09MYX1_BH09MYX1_35520 [soil metagenome]
MKRAWFLLVLVIAWVLPGLARAEDISPLLARARELRCAPDREAAASVVAQLRSMDTSQLGVPLESPKGVRAAVVDVVLDGLAQAHARYPELQRDIEDLVVSWSYCDLLFEGRTWDLSIADAGAQRTPGIASPLADHGFAAWGLTAGVSSPIVPRVFRENGLAPDQREWFVADVFVHRCQAHPTTGRRIFDLARSERPDGIGTRTTESLTTPVKLTLAWDFSCAPPPVHAVTAPVAPPVTPTSVAPIKGSSSVAPVQTQSGSQGDAMASVPLPHPSAKGIGLSGGLYVATTLEARPSTGFKVAFNPLHSFFFARVGLEQRFASAANPHTAYSWGLGYDDWHPGTFSAQINNWGPTPIDEFSIKGAVLDFGYKLPLPDKLSKYVGGQVTLSVPFNGTPAGSFTTTVRPMGNWTAFAGVRYSPLNFETPVTWVYGFGWANYGPYTFSLTYANYGPNAAFKSNFERGTVSLSWSWAL